MDYIREAAFELRMSHRQLAKTLEVSEQQLRNYRLGKQQLFPRRLGVFYRLAGRAFRRLVFRIDRRRQFRQ